MQLDEASILLVDDEPVLLDIVREWFQSMVAQVFCAADGAEALQVLAERRIDLVITDVRMPVMDGITLLKRIKARGLRTPSLIFITGFADIRLRDAYDLGAAALLEKPVECDFLIDRVRQMLSDPLKRWEKQLDLSASRVLRRRFASLSSALQEQQIAFGRGGFCIEKAEFQEEDLINLALDFIADKYVLSGQGAVRWSEENQMGIELIYVAEQCRACAVQLTEKASAFIPRTTGTIRDALAG
jgi:CheY-like chemotaxis protein